ncbi:serine hydrolase [Sphingomonas sp. CFBP 8760]|uniref:serine hydrolase n=1 Tax=Sphingomonas sp. CFBP 8760 TaxID=2775282 RepID=UPI0017832D4F|nr:beta-lactamase family protein [Sphingomonas sp. CFBP 8760]
MRRLFALLALSVAAPAAAQGVAQDGERQAAAIARADAAARDRFVRAVEASGFVGTYLFYRGTNRIAGGSAGAAVAGAPGGFTAEQVWPWASVTKQVVATLVMQEVEAGRLSLDVPAGRYLPALGASSPTIRQLLQHRAGLRNPDDSAADANGFPGSYTTGPGGADWCIAGRGVAGGVPRYNNCDYIVLGALLARTTLTPLPVLFQRRIAGPLGLGARFIDPAVPGGPDTVWAGGPDAGERQAMARFGAAGGIEGTAADLATFDRALLTGSMLSATARAEMWRGDPGFGQSSLAVRLTGCAAPVRLVERRGAIGRFAVRNVIAPDLGLSMVLFTNRGDAGLGAGLGDVRRGLTHDLLSAGACA